MWKVVLLGLGIYFLVPFATCEAEHAQLIKAKAPQFQNADYYRKKLGLDAYEFRPSAEPLKVAIIDQGFADLGSLQGWLPDKISQPVEVYSEELVNDPEFAHLALGDANKGLPLVAGDNHGTLIAHQLWSLLGKPQEGYDFHFLNGNGVLNLQRAAAYCKKYGIKVALVPITLDHSGNRNSGGYANNAFSYAAEKGGVIFLFTAGNKLGQVRHITPRRFTEDGYMEMDDTGTIALRVRSNTPNNPATITVSWDSYGKDEFDVNDDDIDLEVYNAAHQRFAFSNYRQGMKKKKDGSPNPIHPFEEITVSFDKNEKNEYYYIYLRKVAGTFNIHDTVTVTVRPPKQTYVADAQGNLTIPAIEFIDAKTDREIPVLADNKNVITFGDTSSVSARGGALGVPGKPDALSNIETATFEDFEYSGTSFSFVYPAAAVVTMLKHRPSLTANQIFNWISSLPVEESTTNAPAVVADTREVKRIKLDRVLQNKYYENVFQALTSAANGEAPVMAGYYPNTGRLIYGTRYSPNYLKGFEKLNADYAPYYEFYVRYYEAQEADESGQPVIRKYLDSRYRLKDGYGKGQNAYYPWQYENSGTEGEWVELKMAALNSQIAAAASQNRPWKGRVWKTPTPTQLLQLR